MLWLHRLLRRFNRTNKFLTCGWLGWLPYEVPDRANVHLPRATTFLHQTMVGRRAVVQVWRRLIWQIFVKTGEVR